MTTGAALTLDLRKQPNDAVIDRVERALQVRLDRTAPVVKRRSIGLPTDRQTWVRIEARPLDRISGQGWNGVEAAAVLHGIAKPVWQQGVAWSDPTQATMWRADETDLVTAPPIKPGGVLTSDPALTDSWWLTLTSSLAALASQPTTRIAGLQPITQDRITSTIHSAFPGVDTTIDEWTTAHADLAWANLTAPQCHILDWEDWGFAPRGYDAATLRGESLALPELANRVHREFQQDQDSRSGTIALLFQCSKYINAGERAAPLYEPALVLANDLVRKLR
jgi:hypothetical protein